MRLPVDVTTSNCDAPATADAAVTMSSPPGRTTPVICAGLVASTGSSPTSDWRTEATRRITSFPTNGMDVSDVVEAGVESVGALASALTPWRPPWSRRRRARRRGWWRSQRRPRRRPPMTSAVPADDRSRRRRPGRDEARPGRTDARDLGRVAPQPVLGRDPAALRGARLVAVLALGIFGILPAGERAPTFHRVPRLLSGLAQRASRRRRRATPEACLSGYP